MEEKNNSKLVVAVVVLSCLLIVTICYITFKYYNTNQTLSGSNNGDHSEVVTSLQLTEKNTKLELDSKEYKVEIDESTIKIDDKIINNNELFRVYVWHDLLIVIECSTYLNPDKIYVYDKNLNLVNDLTIKNMGWYTEGQNNAEIKDFIELREDSFIVYVKNIGVGGDVISNEKIENYTDISCDDAKGKYKDVVAQEKIVYKYDNGKLSQGEKEVVLKLSDVVCK